MKYGKIGAKVRSMAFGASSPALAIMLLIGLIPTALTGNHLSPNEFIEQRKRSNEHFKNSDQYYEMAKSVLFTDLGKAEGLAEISFTNASFVNDLFQMSKAQYLLGLIHFYSGDLQKSTASFSNALTNLNESAISEDEQTLELKQSIWNNLGVNYDLMEQMDRSAIAYENSIRYARRLNNTRRIYIKRINLALIQARVGLFEQAEFNLKSAEEYFRKAQDSNHLGLTLQNKGRYYQYLNQPDKTLYYLNQALYHLESSENTYAVNSLKTDLVRFHISVRQFDQASRILSELIVDGDPTKITGYHGVALTMFYGILQKEYYRDTNSALHYLEKAAQNIMVYRGYNSRLLNFHLAELYAELGDMRKFKGAMQRYHSSRDVKKNKSVLISPLLNFFSEKEIQQYEERLAELYDVGYNAISVTLFAFILSVFVFIIFVLLHIYKHILHLTKTMKRFDVRKSEIMNSAEITLTSHDSHNGMNDTQLDIHSGYYDQSNKYDEVLDAEEEKLRHLYEATIQYIENKELFLDPKLSLSKLSYELGSNEKYVSMAINRYNGQSFTSLMNQYKVEHAKKLLLNSRVKSSAKKISVASGFGSESTFHRVFKERTGHSPYSWRQLELSKLPMKIKSS